MGLLNTTDVADEHMSADKSEEFIEYTRSSLLIKHFFEKYRSSRVVLLLVVLLGTSMVIGDGILTPTISVLSAVSETGWPVCSSALWDTQSWIPICSNFDRLAYMVLLELAFTTYFTGILVFYTLCHHTISITSSRKLEKMDGLL
ncbi:potassium transporter [Corchorus olitorius]|uniref:Potassium transporter n=1 Tax=Corchorus olitorius TaxID=93759 RepID=A0A1R3JUV0_9ROSI|nr:potassium transporter [Corchorus olitorius]